MTPIAESARLYTTQDARVGEAENRLLRDQASWRSVWETLHAGQAAPPLPAVDFTREAVAFVAVGSMSSGGHEVRVLGTSVDAGGQLIVHVRRTRPGADCMTTQALTSPAEAVRVPRPPRGVRWDVQTVDAPC